jgi:hypothetical protein
MALIMEIMKTIAQPIGELAVWLEETYQVNVSETVAKWHELTGMNITVKEGEVAHDKVQSLDVDSTKNPKSSKKIPKTKDVCQHVFQSGQRVGEQCVTKPKGGATYCSAHKPKDSVKSAVKGVKVPKKKEVKKAIDSEFESDEEAEKPIKVAKEPKKIKKEKVVVPKPVVDDMTSDSDGEPISRAVKYSEAYMDEKEANLDKEKYRKRPTPVVAPLVESDDDLPEPVKPLLKKKNKNGPVKPSKETYDTDDETLDKNLNLSDDE